LGGRLNSSYLLGFSAQPTLAIKQLTGIFETVVYSGAGFLVILSNKMEIKSMFVFIK
jgi:hypothetical protein